MKATKYHGSSLKIDYTPGSAVSAGDVIVIGTRLVLFAILDIAASALGALAYGGVWKIAKKNGALSAGDPVYWDADGNPQGGTAGTGAVTGTSADGVFIGYVLEDAGATDETAIVVHACIDMGQNISAHSLANAIADPGDGNAIPVTATGSVSLETAGAETRTLANPTFAGQQLSLVLGVDGGDCVITAASAVNVAGNNTITMDNAGEHLALIGVDINGTLAWRVLCNDGAALSTV